MENQKRDSKNSNLPKEWRFVHNHPTNFIIGDPSRVIATRNSIRNIYRNLAFLSQIELKNFYEAEFNKHWF